MPASVQMRLKPRMPVLATTLGALATVIGYVLWRGLPELLGFAVLAVVPAAIVGVYVRWTARPEPQPTSTLAWTFALGATALVLPAILISLVLDAFGLPIYLVAGLGEEIAKIAVLAILARRWTHLHDPVTMSVYGLALGGGFAFTENIIYFTATPHLNDLLNMFISRGLLTPFGHPLFTAVTAASLGAYLSARRRGVPAARYLVGGFGLSVTLHALFDAAAVARSVTTLVGTVVGVILLELVLERQRSRRIDTVRMTLQNFPDHVSADDLTMICDVRKRAEFRSSLSRAQRLAFDQWVGQWLYSGMNESSNPGIISETYEALATERTIWDVDASMKPDLQSFTAWLRSR